MMIIYNLVVIRIWLESLLESWGEHLPGSSGDFAIPLITSPLYIIAFPLIGFLGYLIAIKLHKSRNKSEIEVQ